MRTINISISDNDYMNYGLSSENLSFSELEARIKKRTIREALYSCQQIADKEGLSKMSLEEINKEIEAVREKNAKNNY